MLQAFSVSWLDRHAGSGHDVVRDATRVNWTAPACSSSSTG